MEVEASKGFRILDLRIENLRNVRQLRLEFGGVPLVVVTGANGAGKTTILESIYLIGRRRTFRSRRAGPLTTFGESGTRVRGVCETQMGGRMTFEWSRFGSAGAVTASECGDGEARLTVKLIGENAQLLLEGEPELKRRFVDVNVFHVEPSYGSLWKAFSRALSQRNAAIRAKDNQRRLWDAQFTSLGEMLATRRAAFVDSWTVEFQVLTRPFSFLADSEIVFDQGWSKSLTLAEELMRTAEAEASSGYTLTGPSRASFRLTRDGRPLPLSRGQSKIAVSLLQLAAGEVAMKRGATGPVWLVDDLDAELDRGSAGVLWQLILARAQQVVAAAVDVPPGIRDYMAPDVSRLFHVEHGTLSPLPPPL